ncbi:hypothetical protein GGI42DRAFT_356308 [Trichoderma sp. SZMC 28013]
MGHLQALCGPGEHDKAAEVHISPEDVKHSPWCHEIQSFYQAMTPEADTATKKDKGKGPMTYASPYAFPYNFPHPPSMTWSSIGHQRYSSSIGPGPFPSLTSKTTMHTSTVMPRLPNISVATPKTSTSSKSSKAPPLPMLSGSGPSTDHGAGTSKGNMPSYRLASGHQGSTPGYYTQPEAYRHTGPHEKPAASIGLGVPAPRFPFAQEDNVYGRCRVNSDSSSDSSSDSGSDFGSDFGSDSSSGPSSGYQFQHLRAFSDNGDRWYNKVSTFNLPIRPHARYATEPGETPLPSQQPHEPWPMPKPTKPSEICHDIFATFKAWGFTAVEFAQHSRDGANEAVSLGALPKCKCITETVCYWPASGNGPDGIPLLPLSVPGAPMISPREPDQHGFHPSDGAADTHRECAVQLHLGSMEGKVNDMRFYFHNDKMHFNQMIKLQLDVESLARRVAVALAIMHWVACIDARGVQFYLFSQWKSIQRQQLPQGGFQPGQSLESLHQGRTSFRVRHFEDAQTMEMTEDGVKLAVEAVKRSMYIPRPNQELPIQKRTWEAFVSSYIAASNSILRYKGESDSLHLPGLFIDKVITEERNWEIPY